MPKRKETQWKRISVVIEELMKEYEQPREKVIKDGYVEVPLENAKTKIR